MGKRARERELQWGLRLVLPVVALTGCFALFPLDDYGAGSGRVGDGGDARLEGSTSNDATSEGPAKPVVGRLVFVLDPGLQAGELMSLAHADSLCNAEADDAGLHRGTEFKAWLSDRNRTVANRWDASVLAVPDGGAPLQLVMQDGQPIAASFAELADSGPRVPIVVTARNVSLPIGPVGGCVEGGVVFTNTAPNGAGAPNTSVDCNQWSNPKNGGGNAGAFGRAGGSAWTIGCPGVPCTARGYLYCVEQ